MGPLLLPIWTETVLPTSNLALELDRTIERKGNVVTVFCYKTSILFPRNTPSHHSRPGGWICHWSWLECSDSDVEVFLLLGVLSDVWFLPTGSDCEWSASDVGDLWLVGLWWLVSVIGLSSIGQYCFPYNHTSNVPLCSRLVLWLTVYLPQI